MKKKILIGSGIVTLLGVAYFLFFKDKKTATQSINEIAKKLKADTSSSLESNSTVPLVATGGIKPSNGNVQEQNLKQATLIYESVMRANRLIRSQVIRAKKEELALLGYEIRSNQLLKL